MQHEITTAAWKENPSGSIEPINELCNLFQFVHHTEEYTAPSAEWLTIQVKKIPCPQNLQEHLMGSLGHRNADKAFLGLQLFICRTEMFLGKKGKK